MNNFAWSLAEIENMIPFEREIFLFMLIDKLEKEKKNKS